MADRLTMRPGALRFSFALSNVSSNAELDCLYPYGYGVVLCTALGKQTFSRAVTTLAELNKEELLHGQGDDI